MVTMKYGLECPVSSRLKLPGELKICSAGRQFTFTPNGEGSLAQVTVIASVPDPAGFTTRTTIDTEQRRVTVQVNRDEELHSELMLAVQSLESILGFYFNLKNIHWNQAEAFVEVENEAESSQVQVLRWLIKPGITDAASEISSEQMALVISTAKQSEDLATTLAFYREGANDMSNLRYVSAFFNFYFVLEGLYGNGKTKNPAVEAEFKRSKRLVETIQAMVDRGLPKSYGEDEGILERLGRMKKKCTVDNIIALMVSMRGDLHHHVGNPKRPGGSPLTQAKYQTFSMFCMNLCQVILHEEIESRRLRT
jgi:hypothetical protein